MNCWRCGQANSDWADKCGRCEVRLNAAQERLDADCIALHAAAYDQVLRQLIELRTVIEKGLGDYELRFAGLGMDKQGNPDATIIIQTPYGEFQIEIRQAAESAATAMSTT